MATIKKICKEPSPSTMNDLINYPCFAVLRRKVLSYEEESEGQLTVQYLMDVSAMLALISSVRECDIERHMEVEYEMVSLALTVHSE